MTHLASHFQCWMTPLAIASIMALANWPGAARGEAPRVQFDLSEAIACRRLEQPGPGTASTDAANGVTPGPGEVLIEAPLELSLRLLRGSERDLSEVLVEITSPGQTMRVAAFEPTTSQEDVYAGEIQSTTTAETIVTRSLSLGGSLPAPFGQLSFHASPGADLARTRRQTRTETSKRVPDRRVVVSSGTFNQQRGVFFKLRRGHDAPLEDVHTLTIQYLVPANWRGGWIQVSCHAEAVRSGLGKLVGRREVGRASAFVGLYLEGDLEARQVASRLATVQREMLAAHPSNAAERIAGTIAATVDGTGDQLARCLRNNGWSEALHLDLTATSRPPTAASRQAVLRAAQRALEQLPE